MTNLALPSGTHLIHVGPHKTGSTAVQFALHAARRELMAQGVYYASLGKVRAREAGWAVLGMAPVGRAAPRISQWEALQEEVRKASGECALVVVSNEDFGRAKPEEIKAIVDGIGGERPHVVTVVRRLDKYLPSLWQERVKARETRSYEDWLKVVLGDDTASWQWQNAWHAHNVGRLVDRWAAAVGRENITVVVADEGNRSVLPSAFEDMLGLARGKLAMQSRQGNPSLAFNEAELVRELNRQFVANRWSDEFYREYVQGGVVPGLKRTPATDRAKAPGMPGWAVQRIKELCDEQAAAVENAGVRVIGDPASLRPPDLVASQNREVAVDVATAAGAIAGVIDKIQRLEERRGTGGSRSASLRCRLPTYRGESWRRRCGPKHYAGCGFADRSRHVLAVMHREH